MNRRMTFEQYRTMDLTAFAIMLIASESIIQTASTAWFPGQPYTVSVTAAIVTIVLMRWKKYAALHAVLGGLVFCFHLKAGAGQYLIYCLGNLGAMLSLLILRKAGDERIRNDALMSILFALCTQLFMQGGSCGDPGDSPGSLSRLFHDRCAFGTVHYGDRVDRETAGRNL